MKRFVMVWLVISVEVCTAWAQSSIQDMDSAKWMEDLHYLAEQLPKRHKNLYHQISPEEFEQAVAALRQKIPSLSNHEVAVELGRIVALVGDGHTELWLTQPATGFRWYPLIFSFFGDSLYVLAATEPYKQAIGTRVLKIGDVAIEAAYEAVKRLIAHDNDMEYLHSAPVYLAVPEILHALGIVADMDRAVFTLADPEGKVVTVEVQAVAERGTLEWLDARTLAGNKPPLAVQRPEDYYWFEYLEDSQTLYLKYNRCTNQKDKPSIKKFAKAVFDVVDRNPVERFVLDIRHNTGGNMDLNRPIIEGIRERPTINKSGHLFVITGPRTFSAATKAAIEMKKQTEAIFVGEPSRGKPNGYGEVRDFELPNSGIEVDYSVRFYNPIPELGDVPYLPVDMAVENSFEDFRAGRDRVLEAVLAYSQH